MVETGAPNGGAVYTKRGLVWETEPTCLYKGLVQESCEGIHIGM